MAKSTTVLRGPARITGTYFDQAIQAVERPRIQSIRRPSFWRTDEPIIVDEEIKVGGMWAGQRDWWNLDNFVKGFVAGFGAGKTVVGAKRIISSCLQNAPCPVAAISPTFLLARRTTIATIIELLSGKSRLLGGAFWWRFNRSIAEFKIRYHGREGTIIVQSGEDPLRLRGPNLAAAWIDEPFLQQVEVFDQMIARVRHPNAVLPEILLTGCVVRDSLVLTPKGFRTIGSFNPGCNPKQYKRISKEIFGVDNSFHTATQFYNNGEDDTVKLTVRGGYQVEATPDHPVLVMGEDGHPVFKRVGDRKWKYGHLGQLLDTDSVAVARGMECWGDRDPCKGFQDVKMDADLAYGLGVWIAEGSYLHSDGRVVISCGDKSVIDHFVTKGIAGVPFLVSSKSRKDQCRRSSYKLQELFCHLRMPLVKSPKRWLPKWVFSAPREIVQHLLGGMYDGDGHVCRDGQNIGYTTTSLRLARELQILLTNFGVVTAIRTFNNPPTKKSKVWSLRHQVLAQGNNAIKLASALKLRIPRKVKALRRYSLKLRDSDCVPRQAQLIAKLWGMRKNQRWKKGKASLEPNRIAYACRKCSGGPVSYSTLQDFANCWRANETFVPEELLAIEKNISDGYYWAPVQSREKSRAQTVDFVIPDTHSFTPNGIVSLQTPESLNWGYELFKGELKERHDVGLISASTRQNLALNKDYVHRLEGSFTDKAAESYIEGNFVNLSKGMRFYAFHEGNEKDLPVPDGAELGCGMDFNVMPMSAAIFWRSGSHMHFFDEIQLENADTEYMCSILRERFVKNDKFKSNPLREIYPDATGSARKTSSPGGKTDFHYIRDAGFNICAPHANPKIRDRENAVNGKLKPKVGPITLTIGSGCKKIKQFMSTASHDQSRKQKSMNHLLDAVSYPVSYLFPVTRDVVSVVKLHGA